MQSLLSSFSGHLDYYILISIALGCIAIYNGVNIFLVKKALWHGSYEVFSFVIFAVLYNSKLKYKIDLIVEFLLCIAVIVVAPKGTFSGIPFLFLIANRAKRNEHYYIMIAITVLSISANIFIYNFKIQYIFALIFLYVYFGIKYYFHFHIPTRLLKSQNTTLNNKVLSQSSEIADLKSQIQDSPILLTDDQIIQKYPYMYFKETDPDKDPDPYRKIKDLRLLASDKGYIEIALINKISEQTQYREFAKLKKEFKIELNRDKKIDTLWGLVVAGIELGIIHVRYRQPGNIL